MKRYSVIIELQAGNTDASIANAMQELREFRKNHPAPPPPDKPAPRQKRSGRKK